MKKKIKAAYNLIQIGIDALIVVGGDGSLTGANLFRKEWTEYVNELVEQGTLWSTLFSLFILLPLFLFFFSWLERKINKMKIE